MRSKDRYMGVLVERPICVYLVRSLGPWVRSEDRVYEGVLMCAHWHVCECWLPTPRAKPILKYVSLTALIYPIFLPYPLSQQQTILC